MARLKFRTTVLPALIAGILLAGIAAIPHVIWSVERGSVSWFKSGFDEDTYAERALRGESRPDRALSTSVLRAAEVLSLGDFQFSLIGMDVVCAFAAGFLAALLACALTVSWPWRMAVWLSLIFGQELLSTGSFAIWSPRFAMWNWFDDSTWRTLVPLFSTSYFAAFRSPEPQVAWCVLFVSVLLCVHWLIPQLGRWRGREILSVALISAAAFSVYAFVGLAILMTLVWIGLIACYRRCFKEAFVVVGSLLSGAVVYALLSQDGSALSTGAVTFASNLPSISIGMLMSLASLVAIIIKRKSLDFGDPKIMLGSFLVLLPVFYMNQQVVSGRMISTRDFEINVNFQLLTIGSSLLWLRGKTAVGPRWTLAAALGCLAVLSIIALKQRDVFNAWHNHNEVAATFADLIDTEIRNNPKLNESSTIQILIADRFDAGSLTRLKLNQSFPDRRFDFMAYFNDVQDRHIENLKSEIDIPQGRAQHQNRFFEFLARTGVSPEAMKQRFEDELNEKVGVFYSVFFFSISDVWFPHTDRRALRSNWVRSQLPDLLSQYQSFLSSFNPNQTEDSVAYVLTVQELSDALKKKIGVEEVTRRSLESQPSQAVLYRQRFVPKATN